MIPQFPQEHASPNPAPGEAATDKQPRRGGRRLCMMKVKRFLSFTLATVMLAAASLPVATAFSDIPHTEQSMAAESLASLGIVADEENFNPSASLTRAQFCKMAVLAAGFNETSLYSSFTSYPDVPANAWYAPYIYAAVKKYKVIQGYPNGTFGPDDTITYGQAVTILLRMLGYTTEDIGAFWPRDYVIKGQDIGLADGITGLGQNDAIPRGQAAILIRNLLTLDTKESGKFLSTGFTAGDEAILVATSETDPKLDEGKLRFSDMKGETTEIMNPGSISQSMLGVRGTLIYDKTASSRLKGFLAGDTDARQVAVKSATAEYIETDQGKITIPRLAKCYVYGKVSDYTTAWVDIKAGATVSLCNNAQGAIDFVSVRQSTTLSGTFVYGVDDNALPSNARILMNGSVISPADLKKYDIVSYSSKDNAYLVSDKRVSALYVTSGPTYTNPTYIKVDDGTSYYIGESAAKYFKNLTFNKPIVLCFDTSGNVAAAFAQGTVAANATGVMTKLDKGGSVTVQLTDGTKVQGTASFAGWQQIAANQQIVSSLFKEEGRLVKINRDEKGRVTISPITYSKTLAGKYEKSTGKLGNRELAPQPVIYEQPAPGMPLRRIALADLPETMPASRVVHAETDRAGKISLLVLDNITGDGFEYGLLSQTSEEKEVVNADENSPALYRTVYSLKVRTSDNPNPEPIESYYPCEGITTNAVPGAVAIALTPADDKHPDEPRLTVAFSTPGKRLVSAGSVTRDKFDSSLGVRLNNLYVPVDENVQVYNKQMDRFITLAEARANFTSFDLYCDSDPASGGHVRMIIAD